MFLTTNALFLLIVAAQTTPGSPDHILINATVHTMDCLLYTSPSPRD